ncbi:MAG: hypothetical protein ABI388_08675 [Bacteroidia bacterium]
MTFKQRLKFYLVGFALGLLLLLAILNKRGCKGINGIKVEELVYQNWEINETIRCKLKCAGYASDSLFIADVKNCNVNYSKSDVREKPCGKYVLESTTKSVSSYTLLIADCDHTSKILDVVVKNACNCK